MCTHHRDEKEEDLAQGDRGAVTGKTKEASRRDKTGLCRRELSPELVVRVGMLLPGLADTDKTSGGWFITAVCGGGGTEVLQIHAVTLNHYHARVTVGFRHASVGWRVNTLIRRHRLEAGHAVINHFNVSIYL